MVNTTIQWIARGALGTSVLAAFIISTWFEEVGHVGLILVGGLCAYALISEFDGRANGRFLVGTMLELAVLAVFIIAILYGPRSSHMYTLFGAIILFPVIAYLSRRPAASP